MPVERKGPWRVAFRCSCGLLHVKGKNGLVPHHCPVCGDCYPYRGPVNVRPRYELRKLGLVRTFVGWEQE